MKEKLFRFFLETAKITAVFFGTLQLQHIADYANFKFNELVLEYPVYKSFKQLKEDVKKEKKKLGIEDVVLKLEFRPIKNNEFGSDMMTNVAHIICESNREYRIVINPKSANKLVVKHELFHAKRCSEGYGWRFLQPFLRNFEEFLATSYALEKTQNP